LVPWILRLMMWDWLWPSHLASDATCLEYFRRHQELNRVPPCILIIPWQTIFSPFFVGSSAFMPTAPILVFHAPAQNVFGFPYVPTFQKEQPKRKYKNHETEFKCVCEKERFLSRKSGPTRHSNACKVKRLKESAIWSIILAASSISFTSYSYSYYPGYVVWHSLSFCCFGADVLLSVADVLLLTLYCFTLGNCMGRRCLMSFET
jgi:hypothetical protein